MKLPGYYSSGDFARMAQVSVRTIRFYDKQNILKPSYVTPAGARFYTDLDFVKLQQVLLLKYLGFSLEEIKGMTVDNADYHFLQNSLTMQKKLVADKIEQMQLVEQAIDNTVAALEENHQIDWSQMLNLIHLTGMEKSLKSQYENANNISARIRLHKQFSTNTKGWFPWLFETGVLPYIKDSSNRAGESKQVQILELGCGEGSLWTENFVSLPENVRITVSDISEGMIRDIRRNIGFDERFSYACFDCHKIPAEENTYDIVIANHLLFYCEDIAKVCSEVKRVLKDGGIFLCSTYGTAHMQEITHLVQKFDSRIILAAENLYERFGLENGEEILHEFFSKVECCCYEDAIVIDKADPLIEYILSCHGNQNQYLLDRYQEFRQYVKKQVKGQYRITKEAGCFLCQI
ncbi:MAG: methyltransferase domain-containing protein [Agathobacter sp.]|nr:methyltransferase domain-containing protein [Agathobacter sp.]